MSDTDVQIWMVDKEKYMLRLSLPADKQWSPALNFTVGLSWWSEIICTCSRRDCIYSDIQEYFMKDSCDLLNCPIGLVLPIWNVCSGKYLPDKQWWLMISEDFLSLVRISTEVASQQPCLSHRVCHTWVDVPLVLW